jgi:hypothetical protein
VLERQAWLGEFGPLDGVVLHEPTPDADPAADQQPGDPQGASAHGTSAPPRRKLAAE